MEKAPRKNICDVCLRKEYLDVIPKVQAAKAKKYKLDCTKIKIDRQQRKP